MAEASRVLFLDIDGVLCTPRAHVALLFRPGIIAALDPVAVALLGRLWDVDPSLRYVVSSSWRVTHGKTGILSALGALAFTGRMHKDWSTPDMPDATRGDEVSAWLARHPEVTTWACLDDENDYAAGTPLVLTDGESGLSLRDLHALEAHLFGSATALCDAMTGSDAQTTCEA